VGERDPNGAIRVAILSLAHGPMKLYLFSSTWGRPTKMDTFFVGPALADGNTDSFLSASVGLMKTRL
jgi:hypothetical protein